MKILLIQFLLNHKFDNNNFLFNFFFIIKVRHSPQNLQAIIPAQTFTPYSPFNLFDKTLPSINAAETNSLVNNPALNQFLTGNMNGFNPLQILGQGSTLEQISRIAKNLLSMSAANRDDNSNANTASTNLLSSISNAISATNSIDNAKKLTSNAINQSVTNKPKNISALIELSTLKNLTANNVNNKKNLSNFQQEHIANSI